MDVFVVVLNIDIPISNVFQKDIGNCVTVVAPPQVKSGNILAGRVGVSCEMQKQRVYRWSTTITNEYIRNRFVLLTQTLSLGKLKVSAAYLFIYLFLLI